MGTRHSACLVLTILEKCSLLHACNGSLRSAQLHIYKRTRACKHKSLDTVNLSSHRVRGFLVPNKTNAVLVLGAPLEKE